MSRSKRVIDKTPKPVVHRERKRRCDSCDIPYEPDELSRAEDGFWYCGGCAQWR